MEQWLRSEIAQRTSAGVGKPGQQLTNLQEAQWATLRVMGPVIGRLLQYCKIYLQELNQILTVKTGEKSPEP